MRREKENWRLFEHKAYPRMGPVDLQFCFEHYMKLYALKNRNFQACVVVWLLDSYSLGARYLLITTIAQAHTFDRCVGNKSWKRHSTLS